MYERGISKIKKKVYLKEYFPQDRYNSKIDTSIPSKILILVSFWSNNIRIIQSHWRVSKAEKRKNTNIDADKFNVCLTYYMLAIRGQFLGCIFVLEWKETLIIFIFVYKMRLIEVWNEKKTIMSIAFNCKLMWMTFKTH